MNSLIEDQSKKMIVSKYLKCQLGKINNDKSDCSE